jgi:hypothetical protein
MDKVTMRSVNLNAIESRLLCSIRGIGKLADDSPDPGLIKWPDALAKISAPPGRGTNYRLPRNRLQRLTACVRQLHYQPHVRCGLMHS